MSEDVRNEQLTLLKFEKKLMGLAAFVAASSATAAQASSKIESDVPLAAYEDIKNALIHLADVTTKAHATLEQSTVDAGLRALEVSGGRPKGPPSEAVRLLLGIG